MDYSFRKFEIVFRAIWTSAALDPAILADPQEERRGLRKGTAEQNGSGLYSFRKRCCNGHHRILPGEQKPDRGADMFAPFRTSLRGFLATIE
jgi:hypothetical protein